MYFSHLMIRIGEPYHLRDVTKEGTGWGVHIRHNGDSGYRREAGPSRSHNFQFRPTQSKASISKYAGRFPKDEQSASAHSVNAAVTRPWSLEALFLMCRVD